MFSQYNIWLSVFVVMLRFLLLVSEYLGLFLILLISLPFFFEYLKFRVLLVNIQFSLAWSTFDELEPPAVNVSAAAYVN